MAKERLVISKSCSSTYDEEREYSQTVLGKAFVQHLIHLGDLGLHGLCSSIQSHHLEETRSPSLGLAASPDCGQHQASRDASSSGGSRCGAVVVVADVGKPTRFAEHGVQSIVDAGVSLAAKALVQEPLWDEDGLQEQARQSCHECHFTSSN